MNNINNETDVKENKGDVDITLGAPLTVPTGNAARRASHELKWSSSSPVTCVYIRNTTKVSESYAFIQLFIASRHYKHQVPYSQTLEYVKLA